MAGHDNARTGYLAAGITARWTARRASGTRVRWLPVVTFLALTFAFMPKALLALGVFGPFDILEYASPWRDALATAPHVSTAVQNDFVQAIPVLEAIITALRHGHWLIWTPYVAGGEPIGALPLSGVQSPFNLLLVGLPAGWGLAVVAAARLLFSQAFFYLFLRRLKVSVPVSTFGAVAYTFCGTNIVLLGRINAYLILPALLWAVARVLQGRRPRDVALLAIASALAWLEGFPAGFVNVIAIACLLALFLVIPLVAGGRGTRAIARRGGVALALIGCGLALSAGLVGFSVLPFERLLTQSGLIAQRNYNASDHLSPVLLPAMFSVGALGNLHQSVLMPTREPNGTIGGAGNAVELEGGAGLIVVLTAAGGIVVVLLGRVRLTRAQQALYLFGLTSVVGGLLLVYFDTPLLALFYDLPLLGVSSANRFRIVVNLGFVILACLGLDGFAASRRSAQIEPGTEPELRGVSVAVRILAGLALLAVIQMVHEAWPGYVGWLNTPLASNVHRKLLLETLGGLILGAGAYVVLHRSANHPNARPALLACVGSVLTVATFATVAFPIRYFTATVPSSLLYPRTQGHAELARLAGQRYRILGSGLATFYSNTSIIYRYLDLRGLSISNPTFRTLVKAAIPDAYTLDAFKVIYDPTLEEPINFASPALDDLGVRYYVASTNETPFATNVPVRPPVATELLTSSDSVASTIHTHRRLEGFGIPVQRASACNGARLVVHAFSPDGRLIATAERPAFDAAIAAAGALAFTIPEVGSNAPRTMRVTIGMTGPKCHVAAGVDRSGKLTASQLVEPAGGMPIVADDEGVFYERPHAHPIVWMTGRWNPAKSSAAALKLATAPSRRSSDPVPVAGAGAPPTHQAPPGHVESVRYVSDGFDVRLVSGETNLLATGFAASSSTWRVSVDGRPARLALVDGALLGTVIGVGVHTVSFRYMMPDLALGAALSGLSLLVLVGLFLVGSRPFSLKRGQATRTNHDHSSA
jgi:hypothetical protein